MKRETKQASFPTFCKGKVPNGVNSAGHPRPMGTAIGVLIALIIHPFYTLAPTVSSTDLDPHGLRSEKVLIQDFANLSNSTVVGTRAQLPAYLSV